MLVEISLKIFCPSEPLETRYLTQLTPINIPALKFEILESWFCFRTWRKTQVCYDYEEKINNRKNSVETKMILRKR